MIMSESLQNKTMLSELSPVKALQNEKPMNSSDNTERTGEAAILESREWGKAFRKYMDEHPERAAKIGTAKPRH